MRNDRLLNLIVFTVVTALHALLILVAWQTVPPQLNTNNHSLNYVDLSGLASSGDTNTSTPAAPAAAQSEPKPKPKSVTTSKPVLKPVIKATPRNDIATPVEKAQPKPQETAPPKSPEKTVTANTSKSSAAETHAQGNTQGNEKSGNHQGNTAQNAGSGGGSSGGALVPATHIGGHLNNPRPPYPSLSRENGEQGSVQLRVQVSADGRAQSVAVVRGSGYARLDRAAKAAVERYRFSPATRGGIPIPYAYTFSIHFRLQDN